MFTWANFRFRIARDDQGEVNLYTYEVGHCSLPPFHVRTSLLCAVALSAFTIACEEPRSSANYVYSCPIQDDAQIDLRDDATEQAALVRIVPDVELVLLAPEPQSQSCERPDFVTNECPGQSAGCTLTFAQANRPATYTVEQPDETTDEFSADALVGLTSVNGYSATLLDVVSDAGCMVADVVGFTLTQASDSPDSTLPEIGPWHIPPDGLVIIGVNKTGNGPCTGSLRFEVEGWEYDRERHTMTLSWP